MDIRKSLCNEYERSKEFNSSFTFIADSHHMDIYNSIIHRNFNESLTEYHALVRKRLDEILLDLRSSDRQLQLSALTTAIQILEAFKYSLTFCVIDEVPQCIFQIAFGDADPVGVNLAACRCVKLIVEMTILRQTFKPAAFFISVGKYDSQKDALRLIEELIGTKKRPEDYIHWQHLTYEVAIHEMYTTQDETIRKLLIQMGFELVNNYPVHGLPANLLKSFKLRVEQQYITIMGEQMKSEVEDWHQLCMFLFICFGRLLHINPYISITNAILKQLEAVFRSPTTEKLPALECWKGLIDNCGLNLERMKVDKQIRLLVTPLKSHISRESAVINKRFELWAHLMEVMKEHALLSIMYFLDFCFGPFVEVDKIICIRCPARKLPFMWERITFALMEMLGHNDHQSNECVISSSSSSFCLSKPIITRQNYNDLKDMLVPCMTECLLLMPKWLDRLATNSAVTCLVGSFVKLVFSLDIELKKEEFKKLFIMFTKLLKNNSSENFEAILAPILNVLSKTMYAKTWVVFKTIGIPLLEEFINKADVLPENTVTLLYSSVCNYHTQTDLLTWMKEMLLILLDEKRSNASSRQLDRLREVWMKLVDVFPILLKRGMPNDAHQLVIKAMIWPMSQLERTNSKTIVDASIKLWSETFSKLYNLSPNKATEILVTIQHDMKNSLNILNSVVQFLPGFEDMLNTQDKLGKMSSPLINVIYTALLSPDITKEGIDLCENCLMALTRYHQTKSKGVFLTEVFLSLCRCFELLFVKEKYGSLITAKSLFELVPRKLIATMPANLMTLIKTLHTNRNPEISKNAKALSELIEAIAGIKPFHSQITSVNPIINVTPPLKNPLILNNIKATPSTSNTSFFNIFHGKTFSPNQPKKLHINNPKDNRSEIPSTSTSAMLDTDDDASYILINERVKFDPNKLSDHQLEVLKKPRYDIPALYQDLTQSDSNSEAILEKMKEAAAADNNKKICSDENAQTSKDIDKPVPHENLLPVDEQNNEIEKQTGGQIERYDYVNSNALSDSPLKVIATHLHVNDFELTNSEVNTVSPEDDGKKNVQKKRKEEVKCVVLPKKIQDVLDTSASTLKNRNSVAKELNRLTMNIVGGEQIIQDLDLNHVRKTRRSIEQRNLRSCNKPYVRKNKPSSITSSPTLRSSTINKSLEKTIANKVVAVVPKTRGDVLKTTEMGMHSTCAVTPVAYSEDVIESSQESLVQVAPQLSCASETIEPSCSSPVSYGDMSHVKNKGKETKDNCDTQVESALKNGGSSKLPQLSCATETVDPSCSSPVLYNDISHLKTKDKETKDNCDTHVEPAFKNGSSPKLPQLSCATEIIEPSCSSPVSYGDMSQVKNKGKETKDNCDTQVESALKNGGSPKLPKDLESDVLSPDQLMNTDLKTGKTDNTAEMDTETLEIIAPNSEKWSPQQNLSIILTSPVRHDTPTRTKEFVDNTLDISPIKSLLKNDGDIENNDVQTLESKEKVNPSNVKLIVLNGSHKEINLKQNKPVEQTSQLEKSPSTSLYGRNSRSAKLLAIISPKQLDNGEIKKTNTNVIDFQRDNRKVYLSLKTRRIMTMMKNCKETNGVLKEENANEKPTANTSKEFDENEDILSFTRTLPGPEASPQCGILKRKAPDTKRDDSPPKKLAKKVNFPDPPLTCEKYYILDENERSRTYSNLSKVVTSPFKLFEDPEDYQDHAYHIKSTEPEVMDTSFEDEPIFPQLVNSKMDINDKLDQVSEPPLRQSLLQELVDKKIETVGDLALLNEREINRLPFKIPKVKEVRKLLLDIYTCNINNFDKTVGDKNSESIISTAELEVEESVSCKNANNLEENTDEIMQDKDNLNKIDESICEEEKCDLNLDSTSQDVNENITNLSESRSDSIETIVLSMENMFETVSEDTLLEYYSKILNVIKPKTFLSLLRKQKLLSMDDLVDKDDWSSIISEIALKVQTNVILPETLESALSNFVYLPSADVSLHTTKMQKLLDLLQNKDISETDRQQFFDFAVSKIKPTREESSALFLQSVADPNDESKNSAVGEIVQSCVEATPNINNFYYSILNKVPHSAIANYITDTIIKYRET